MEIHPKDGALTLAKGIALPFYDWGGSVSGDPLDCCLLGSAWRLWVFGGVALKSVPSLGGKGTDCTGFLAG